MYSKLSHSWFKHWDFILLDIVCLQLSFFLAYALRHGGIHLYNTTIYRSEAIILLVSQLLVTYSYRKTFSSVLERGYYLEFLSTIKHVILVMVYALVILFIGKVTSDYSRFVFGVMGVLYVITGYVGRIILKFVLKRGVARKNVHSLIVVTTREKADEVLENIEQMPYQKYLIKGVCILDVEERAEIGKYPVINGTDRLIEYACREWVDEVFFSLSADEEIQKLLDTLAIMGITTHVPIAAKNIKGSNQFLEELVGHTVLTTSISVVDARQMLFKRILDIIGGIVGCMITLVLTIIVGPIIYIKSPGPVFFTQTRIGKNGRKFKIYKFRSMYMDAEERKKELMAQNKMNGHMFKLDYDPRIIGSEKIGKNGKPKGIGNFIRATSIDEFPQFWNVLKGDMSLVGTRPPTVDEWEKYELHHRARMAIKPGITGMWQVSGRSQIIDFEQVVKLDTEYIQKWNLGLDIKILLMTVIKVLKNDGAV